MVRSWGLLPRPALVARGGEHRSFLMLPTGLVLRQHVKIRKPLPSVLPLVP